jgi:hypothetical protein
VGKIKVNTVAITTLTTTSNGSYCGGSSQRGASKTLNIYINKSGTIGFEQTAPNKADTVGSVVGDLIYWYDGAQYWRWTGSVNLDASQNIIQTMQIGDWIHVLNGAGYTANGTVGTNYSAFNVGPSVSNPVPAISTIVKLVWQTGASGGTTFYFQIAGQSVDYLTLGGAGPSGYSACEVEIPVNSSGVFNYKSGNGSYLYGTMYIQAYYIGNMRH